MKYSIIIPIYNRPDEIKELLESLVLQTYQDFEVLVIEDGSTVKCEYIVKSFQNQLKIHYFYKENSGQGFSRNYGFERAKGDYFIVFDSDCIIPPDYLQTVDYHIKRRNLDGFGGPDKAHSSFTAVQKAISYAMTSLISTGGIRGNEKSAEKFRPRSFNMGISRAVFEKVGGFKITRMGEDIEYSIRIEKSGLIKDAFVYHKRRTNFGQFFKQLHFFGRARINVMRFFPKELKLVHTFPALFVLFCATMPIIPFISWNLAQIQWGMLALYVMLIFSDAVARNKNAYVGLLSIVAVFVQLFAYGIGFMGEVFKKKSL
jgi:glycosyltransferase involved in cell wall biosynthesis